MLRRTLSSQTLCPAVEQLLDLVLHDSSPNGWRAQTSRGPRPATLSGVKPYALATSARGRRRAEVVDAEGEAAVADVLATIQASRRLRSTCAPSPQAAARRRDRLAAARRRAPSTASRRRGCARPSRPEACLASTASETSEPVAIENEIGRAAGGLGEHVGPLRDGRVACAEERKFLAREHEHPRGVRARDRELPRLERFERVGRTNDVAVRRRAQRRELFDRLVRRAVFARGRPNRA